MRKRVRLLLIGGAVTLGAAGIVFSLIVKYAAPEFARRAGYGCVTSPDNSPKVILGYDGDWSRGGPVIHIDVRGGVACSRLDGSPVKDVIAYVSSEMKRTDAHLVVVSAGHREKFGDVVAVVDACRKTSVSSVVLNQYTSDFSK